MKKHLPGQPQLMRVLRTLALLPVVGGDTPFADRRALRSERARRSSYRFRFGVIYVALAAVVVHLQRIFTPEVDSQRRGGLDEEQARRCPDAGMDASGR